MSDKYIKLKINEEDGLVSYQVLETRNINFVEPGYIYGFPRPQMFKDGFEDGYWDGVDIHMVL